MKTFKLGQIVTCPPDRGIAGYTGKVAHIDETKHRNIHGVEYIWITVKHPCGSKHVWPSHRLS